MTNATLFAGAGFPDYPKVAPRLEEAGFWTTPVCDQEVDATGKTHNRHHTMGKCARVKGWQNTWQNPRRSVDEMRQYWGEGVGILCGVGDSPVVAIDCDCLIPEIADRFRNLMVEKYGAPVYRIGKAPKALYPFRLDDPNPQKWQVDYARPEVLDENGKLPKHGEKHRLELLSKGQQFVVWSIHPETKEPYRWYRADGTEDPGALLEWLTPEHLPVLTADDLQGMMREYSKWCEEYGLVWIAGWREGSASKQGEMSFQAKAPDPLAHAVHEKVLQDIGLKEAEEEYLPYVSASNYDDWLKVLQALHHQGRGDYEWLLLADAWSQTQPSYAGFSDVEGKWNSFKEQPVRDSVTFRTVIDLANQGKARGVAPVRLPGTPERTEDYARKMSALSVLEGLTKAVDDPEAHRPIGTGLSCLNKAIGGDLDGGFYRGSLALLGASTSAGKTSLAVQMVDAILDQGLDVLYVSLEMTKEELVSRSLARSSTSDIEPETITYLDQTRVIFPGAVQFKDLLDPWRRSQLSATDAVALDRVGAIAGRRAEAFSHLYVWEPSEERPSHLDVEYAVYKHKQMTGHTPIVVVDYLQLLGSKDPRLTDKQATDANVVALKRIANRENTLVLCISSFNRQLAKNSTIDESAFKESGAIEYTADLLLGLATLKPDGTPVDDNEGYRVAKSADPRLVEVQVLKNRRGRVGAKARLLYYPAFGLFKAQDYDDYAERVAEAKEAEAERVAREKAEKEAIRQRAKEAVALESMKAKVRALEAQEKALAKAGKKLPKKEAGQLERMRTRIAEVEELNRLQLAQRLMDTGSDQ